MHAHAASPAPSAAHTADETLLATLACGSEAELCWQLQRRSAHALPASSHALLLIRTVRHALESTLSNYKGRRGGGNFAHHDEAEESKSESLRDALSPLMIARMLNAIALASTSQSHADAA
jgi:hypothetical protein